MAGAARGAELDLLRFLDSLDEEGKSARELSAKHWDESMRQLKGDQWRMSRNPHFMANIIKNQVDRKVAALTEVKPTIKVVPTKGQLEGAATILNQTIKALWDAQQVDQVLYRLSRMAMTVGAGFLHTYWDSAADGYKGDIQIRMLDPRRVVIDPGVTEAENLKDGAYIAIETFDTLNNIRQRFPGRGALVKADSQYSSTLMPKNYGGGGGVISAVLRQMPRVFKPGPAIKQGPIQRAILREYWIRDPQIGLDGQPLYPTGRHVIRAGDVVLVDENNPYWDGMWPIDMFDWSPDLDSPWGLGEVPELRRLQEAFNRIGDGIVRNALISNNVKIIADMDALEPDQWDQVTNEDGLIIKKRPGREFTYEYPREMPAYLFQLMTQLIQMAEMLTGNTDLSKQSPSGGPLAASALEGIQAQAQTLVRAVARRLEGVLERMGQKLISRVIQFYTHDRVLHMLGPSNEWIGYTYERQKMLTKDDGSLRQALEREQMFKDFRFLVVPGSSLATTRVQRTMMAMQLRAALGVVPPVKTILKEADLGDPDELIAEGLAEAQKYGFQPPQPGKKKK